MPNTSTKSSKKTNFFLSVFIVFLLIIIDQFSKQFAINSLQEQPNYIYNFAPFLSFVYSWNYGISFGWFSEYYEYSNYAFLVINSFIILYMIYIVYKSETKIVQISICLVIGGALGNLIDRVIKGAVFDFIYFHYNQFSFPAFNMADSFITIGAVIFAYGYIFKKI